MSNKIKDFNFVDSQNFFAICSEIPNKELCNILGVSDIATMTLPRKVIDQKQHMKQLLYKREKRLKDREKAEIELDLHVDKVREIVGEDVPYLAAMYANIEFCEVCEEETIRKVRWDNVQKKYACTYCILD